MQASFGDELDASDQDPSPTALRIRSKPSSVLNSMPRGSHEQRNHRPSGKSKGNEAVLHRVSAPPCMHAMPLHATTNAAVVLELGQVNGGGYHMVLGRTSVELRENECSAGLRR